MDAGIDITQDIFLDVLSSTATKREAKAYLQRYSPRKVLDPKSRTVTQSVGVNLGSLYLPIRSVDESPIFTQSPTKTGFSDTKAGALHVALVKIKNPQAVEDAALDGVGHTLWQLSRLGLNCIVVVDPSPIEYKGTQPPLSTKVAQVDRIVEAIDKQGRPGARRLDSVLETVSFSQASVASVQVRGATRVINRNLILAPVEQGVIPVIAPIVYNRESQNLSMVRGDDVVLALAQDLAGLQTKTSHDEEPEKIVEKMAYLQKRISLDRLIILDPLGGIPSSEQAHRAHVFINLEQEYGGIRNDLLRSTYGMAQPGTPESSNMDPSQALTSSNPYSLFVASKMKLAQKNAEQTSSASGGTMDVEAHVQNLDLLRNVLGLLPPTSSAIVTTPREAANPKSLSSKLSDEPGVGTRPRRNPLIHNLLTDKPIFSSSLPASSSRSVHGTSTATPSTFAKRGMPVTIIPDPHLQPWKPPTASSPSVKLSDPRIDMARLVHLIEDSFNRKLDVPHYLSRISERIAGIIICGNYEGGAILTWEAPFPDCKPEQMVPYLDKFAVLKRSQGAGGVADIVFKAMVGDCFPTGVCWRSRRDNPVNKWYFERSKGTWKMPSTNWTMFWTTEGVETGDDRGFFGDYAKVCRDVVPSWADKKAVID